MVDRAPNTKLQAVIAETGISAAALAARVTQLAADKGHTVHYTHRSVANWTRNGIQPDPKITSGADERGYRLGVVVLRSRDGGSCGQAAGSRVTL